MDPKWAPFTVPPPAPVSDRDDEEVLDRSALKKAALGILQSSGSPRAPMHSPARASMSSSPTSSSTADSLRRDFDQEPVIFNSTDTAVTVTISDFKLTPKNIVVRFGTKIIWRVDASEPGMIEYSLRTTQTSDNAQVFSSPVLSRGDDYELQLTVQAGVIRYRDSSNGLSGTIEVVTRGMSDTDIEDIRGRLVQEATSEKIARQAKADFDSHRYLSRIPAFQPPLLNVSTLNVGDVSQLSPRLTSPRAKLFANMCKQTPQQQPEALDEGRAELVEQSLQIYYAEKAQREQDIAAGRPTASPGWKTNMALAGALPNSPSCGASASDYN
jgi:hypothetical protein